LYQRGSVALPAFFTRAGLQNQYDAPFQRLGDNEWRMWRIRFSKRFHPWYTNTCM